MGIFSSLFKSYSEKQIKKIIPTVDKIEALEEKYRAMSDDEMRGCTERFKLAVQSGETLDKILPDAFALVREADRRVLGKRPFRVQLIGGVLLHQGRIAEMKTGEGKTLVATMPAYLNALSGKGVHIVTVNEYLAKRDSEEMGKVFKFLGLTVGLVERDMNLEEKKAAYNADITYGMNSEFGFDYLRDNTARYKDHLVTRGFDYAIVDEVDSILIDEAKTPLIISATSDKSTSLYKEADKLVRSMRAKVMLDTDAKEDYNSFEEHFTLDESSGLYVVMRSSEERLLSTYDLDPECDLVGTQDRGLALTPSGAELLTKEYGFSDADLDRTDGEEFYFTESGKKRAEDSMNVVIIEGDKGAGQSLTEHGRDKLIKFFGFTEKMFVEDSEGKGYSIILKAKPHAMKELSLSEKDFTTFERNFVVNEKAKIASFLELGMRNAKEFLGFSDEDFQKNPIGSDYQLTESGANRLKEVFKLSQKDLTEARDGVYNININSKKLVMELLAKNMIIDERRGVIRFTTLGAKKLMRLFSLAEKHFKFDGANSMAEITEDGFNAIRERFALSSKHFRAMGDLLSFSEAGKKFLIEYSELTDDAFSSVSALGEFALTEDGIKEIKRQFSLSDTDLYTSERAAYLTGSGARKLTEAFDMSPKGLISLDKKIEHYSFSRSLAEELYERLGIGGECFATNIHYNGLFMLDNLVSRLKDEIALIENADFIYLPKKALLRESGKEKLISLFKIEKDDLTEADGEKVVSKRAQSIFKRIFALDELYSPLILTKGGIDKLAGAINFDYIVNEKRGIATLTKIGIGKAEKFFHINNIADEENADIYHHVTTAIRAWGVNKKDVHYVIKDAQVFIVDQSTGRILPGRRFSEGLHQAIEAKERLEIKRESKTIATISYQNFFRMYRKLSGMTGTALTEDQEFREIYSLDVVEVPTNKSVRRIDHNDMIFTTRRAKLNAILTEIIDRYRKGQPILVGTTSVEKSEELSRMLKREKIPHNVLNAKEHKSEARIIAEAGMPKAVTIATNMAGRGTDIMLGGNPETFAKAKLRTKLSQEKKYYSKGSAYIDTLVAMADGATFTDSEDVIAARELYTRLLSECREEALPRAAAVKDAGGLFVIGTERHHSRRIDNQLRGRSGRQGDVGESRFYLSFEDDLLKHQFERFSSTFTRIGMDENTPMDFKLVSSFVERAQKSIESRHFAARKQVLSYDDVMNEQRKVVYGMRRDILESDDIEERIKNIITSCVGSCFDECYGLTENQSDKSPLDFPALFDGMLTLTDPKTEQVNEKSDAEEEEMPTLSAAELSSLKQKYTDRAIEIFNKKLEIFGAVQVNLPGLDSIDDEALIQRVKSIPALSLSEHMKKVLLRNLDTSWIDHLEQMEDLKSYVGLNSYAQRNPLVAYRIEGAEMFSAMMQEIRHKTTKIILKMKPDIRIINGSFAAAAIMSEANEAIKAAKSLKRQIRMGDLCPCGSGKKYKHCCYERDAAEGRA